MPSIFSATLRCEFVSQKSSLQDTHLMNRLPLCKASGQIRYPHPGPPHAWPEGAVPARCGPGSSLTTTPPSPPPACSGVWDNITCWRPADVGETVTVPCPKLFSNFYSKPGTGPYLSFFLWGRCSSEDPASHSGQRSRASASLMECGAGLGQREPRKLHARRLPQSPRGGGTARRAQPPRGANTWPLTSREHKQELHP